MILHELTIDGLELAKTGCPIEEPNWVLGSGGLIQL